MAKSTTPYIRLTFERNKRRWNQRDVGQLMKTLGGHHRTLGQQEISHIEIGRMVPTKDELEALGRVFKYSPASALLEPVTVPDPNEDTSAEENTPTVVSV